MIRSCVVSINVYISMLRLFVIWLLKLLIFYLNMLKLSIVWGFRLLVFYFCTIRLFIIWLLIFITWLLMFIIWLPRLRAFYIGLFTRTVNYSYTESGIINYSYNKPALASKISNFYTGVKAITNFLNKYPQLKYTTTLFWRKAEPINFVFLVSSEHKLVEAFLRIWFSLADDLNLRNLRKLILAAYKGKHYETAPMSPIFWNWKPQLFWFQKQEKKCIAYRHHIRIWNTYMVWNNFLVFVWNADYDNGIKRKITHKIDPDIDKEREYIFNKLKESNCILKYEKIQLVSPMKWKTTSFDDFFTDGKAYVIQIV